MSDERRTRWFSRRSADGALLHLLLALLVVFFLVTISLGVVAFNNAQRIDNAQRAIKPAIVAETYAQDVLAWHNLQRGCARTNVRVLNANRRVAAIDLIRKELVKFADAAVISRTNTAKLGAPNDAHKYAAIGKALRAIRIPLDKFTVCGSAYPKPTTPEGVRELP